MAAAAGMQGNTYTGHAYATSEVHLECDPPVIVRGIIEGTKWVEPYLSGVVTMCSRNAGSFGLCACNEAGIVDFITQKKSNHPR